MTRYTDPKEAAIARLQAEAEVTGQVIEDLSRALEDSEAMCDRYREALVHIDQLAAIEMHHVFMAKAKEITRNALWTRRSDAA